MNNPATIQAVPQDDFILDIEIQVARHPVGKLLCDTGDGCGNTCAGSASACNSFVGDPF